ncbi:MAG: nucleotidyltransferase family protein [Nitrospirota bacterium]
MADQRIMNRLRQYLSPEERFVLDASGAFVRGGKTGDTEAAAGLDVSRIAQIVHINNIGPVFHYLFRERGFSLPGMDGWGQLRMRVLFANIQKLRLAVRIFGILEKAGIRSVGLRGVTLANLYYPEAALRPMKDLDILVDADAGPGVLAAMSAAGYETTNRLRSQLIYVIDGVEIEIHLSLLTAKRYRAAFDSRLLLDARVRVETAEGVIYRLPIEHELIELVAHAFVHHELQGFTRIMDIALVMARPETDWKAIGRWCRDAQLSNMYLFTLSLADALFETGNDAFRRHIDAKLPFGAGRLFSSYGKLYFGGDNLLHYACRKKNMFYVAERPGVKLNQFWRLFSASHFREMKQVMTKGKTPLIRG